MKIALKESKVKKLKKILNTNIFFIICNTSSITSDKFLKLTQGLIKLNLYCYKVNITLTLDYSGPSSDRHHEKIYEC